MRNQDGKWGFSMFMSEAITEFGFDCKIRKLSPKTIQELKGDTHMARCEKDNRNPITTCTFTWEDCGLSFVEDVLCVKTRILHNEIQIRFYNGYGLMNGRILPLSDQQRQEFFDLLGQCCNEWKTDDFSVDVCDGSRWQLKMCSKGKCLRTIEGTVELPPRGQEIRDYLSKIIGDDCYIF